MRAARLQQRTAPARKSAPVPRPQSSTEADAAPSPPDVQAMHRQIVALGAPCPALPWYDPDYDHDFDAPIPTSPEGYVLQELHAGICALGAQCTPPDPETLESLRRAHEAGARHSAADRQAIQRAHDACVEAGAECAMESDDDASTGSNQGTTEALGGIPRGRAILREGGDSALPVVTATTLSPLRGEAIIRIIQPGFNSSHARYYTSEAVKSIANAMVGRKMYVDHSTPSETRERPERSLTTLGAILEETWIDPKDGAAYGKAQIVQPEFLALVTRLAEAGQLDQLGVSINAVGIGSKMRVAGEDTFRVEAVDETDVFRSVDWVTEPGAGGRALLVESAGAARAARPAPHTQGETTVGKTRLVAEASDTSEDDTDEGAPNYEDRLNALEAATNKIMGAVTGMQGAVEAMARAHGLDGLLAAHKAAEAVKVRVRAQLLASPEAITEARVKEAIEAELAYARSVTGSGSRSGATSPSPVVGLGAPLADGATSTVDLSEITALLDDLEAEGKALGAKYDRRTLESVIRVS